MCGSGDPRHDRPCHATQCLDWGDSREPQTGRVASYCASYKRRFLRAAVAAAVAEFSRLRVARRRLGGAVWRHVNTGVTESYVGHRLFVPIVIAGPRKAEEIPLPNRALRNERGPSLGRLLWPRHLAAPRRPPRLEVHQKGEAGPLIRLEVRAPVQNVGAVHQQAARWSDHGYLDVCHCASIDVERGEGHVCTVLVADDASRAVVQRHVGEVNEGGHLLVTVVEAWDHQAVTPIVAMEGLVVVDGTGVLRPQLNLVEVKFWTAEIALRRIDKIGMDGQTVEVP